MDAMDYLRETHEEEYGYWQKNREEEDLAAKEDRASHWEQRVGEMDPLILCLHQHTSAMHVCGMDPRKLPKVLSLAEPQAKPQVHVQGRPKHKHSIRVCKYLKNEI